ncbi:MAG: YwqG family protein [Pseudomonadota bacterium]
MSQAEKLIADLIENIHEVERTRHVGRHNRLFSQRRKILGAIDAEADGPGALYRLLSHPDAKVRDVIAHIYLFSGQHKQESLAVMQELAERHDQLGKNARRFLEERLFERKPEPSLPHEPRKFPFEAVPDGISGRMAEKLITEAGFGEAVCALLRPAIRLWPVPASPKPTASRLGGLPAVPADFGWPAYKGEPFWFLGQINCAELGARAEAFGLPRTGLLSFFGDGDDVTGCSPAGGGKIYYFADTRALSPARLPLDDFEPQISCGLTFFETFELPHFYEPAVEARNFPEAQEATYIDLRLNIASLGKPHLWEGRTEISKLMSGYEISKLFGCPDRIQINDVESPGRWGAKLLFQLGYYTNGEERHGWGPGGLIYFTLAPHDLKARRFDRAELSMQAS